MNSFKDKWEWVAHFPLASGTEAIWCLERNGVRYASLHKHWDKYLAFLKSSMVHNHSGDTLEECARKTEALFIGS